jgi:hypothetical protein
MIYESMPFVQRTADLSRGSAIREKDFDCDRQRSRSAAALERRPMGRWADGLPGPERHDF